MSKTDDSLNAAFDITALGSVTTANVQGMVVSNSVAFANAGFVQAVEVQPYIEHVDEDEDFEEVRGNLKSLVRKGNKMLDRMIEIADSSERDRTFEVAGTLLKNLAEINKDLISARKTHKESKNLEKNTNDGGSVNIDKAVFVGTTSDLLDHLENKKIK